MQGLKTLALQETELATPPATIRSRLSKIGATVLSNTRRIRILFASHHPLRSVFLTTRPRLGLPLTPTECAPDMRTLRGEGTVSARRQFSQQLSHFPSFLPHPSQNCLFDIKIDASAQLQ